MILTQNQIDKLKKNYKKHLENLTEMNDDYFEDLRGEFLMGKLNGRVESYREVFEILLMKLDE